MTKCTERELLERLTTDEAMSYPVDFGNPGYPGDEGVEVDGALHCDYCDANVDSDGPHNKDCPWADTRAYLAQRMTKCEEREGELVAQAEEAERLRVELRVAAIEAHSYYSDHRQFPSTAHRGSFADCPHGTCAERRALSPDSGEPE